MTLIIGRGTVVVVMTPTEFVTTSVTTGAGEVITGSAETLVNEVFWPKIALYVVLARPAVTMPPTDAETEVLNAYVGVAKVGDGRRKLGRVVATVADAADINESMAGGV